MKIKKVKNTGRNLSFNWANTAKKNISLNNRLIDGLSLQLEPYRGHSDISCCHHNSIKHHKELNLYVCLNCGRVTLSKYNFSRTYYYKNLKSFISLNNFID